MSDTRQLVIFSLAREEYALPITRVQEIIRYTQPRSVASSAPWIRGVINLRGKIVPVCDLAMRLGLAHEHSESAKIAVVETEGRHRRHRGRQRRGGADNRRRPDRGRGER
jgi:purine-binding chemotaxis protein CheW